MTTDDKYILHGKKAVICNDLVTWATWFETADRTVAGTVVKSDHPAKGITNARISTVFLGIDHNWRHNGEPILFETMVFDSAKYDGESERYCTWEEAEAGHKLMVEKVTQCK